MPNATPSTNSTNVRLASDRDAGATGRGLALALVAWAFAVALAAFDGVFARLDAGWDLALAVFAAAFAIGAYVLDPALRALVDRGSFARLGALALAGDAALAIALFAAAPEGLVRGAMPLLAYFAAPVALAAHMPAMRALARRLRRAPGRSPGARPAAT